MTPIPLRLFDTMPATRHAADLCTWMYYLLGHCRSDLRETARSLVDSDSEDYEAVSNRPHLTSCIRKAQNGDHSAFRELVNEYKLEVLRLASRFTRNETELDELAQDIFIEIHRSLGRFEGRAPFIHWLRKIAVRRCKDHLRRRYRWLSRWVPWTDKHLISFQMEEPSVDGQLEKQSAKELLETAMAKLSPKSYTLIVMYELEGYSTSDIAEAHSWSSGNARVQLHRARKELETIARKLIDDESHQ